MRHFLIGSVNFRQSTLGSNERVREDRQESGAPARGDDRAVVVDSSGQNVPIMFQSVD